MSAEREIVKKLRESRAQKLTESYFFVTYNYDGDELSDYTTTALIPARSNREAIDKARNFIEDGYHFAIDKSVKGYPTGEVKDLEDYHKKYPKSNYVVYDEDGNIVESEDIKEAEDGEFEYVFRIPWRETIEYANSQNDEVEYIYEPKHMEHATEIINAAEKDWNQSHMEDYANRDNRTKSAEIQSMKMSFNRDLDCLITVKTSKVLDEKEVSELIDWLEGQMSDGWGEGFEQQEIDRFTYDAEFEEYDEESDEYYTETYSETAYVYGQFWWYDSNDKRHPWDIDLVSSPVQESEDDLGDIDEAVGPHHFVTPDKASIMVMIKDGKYVLHQWDYNKGWIPFKEVSSKEEIEEFIDTKDRLNKQELLRLDDLSEIQSEESLGESLEVSNEIFQMKRNSEESWDFYDSIRAIVLDSISKLEGIEIDDDGLDDRTIGDRRIIEYRAQIYEAIKDEEGKFSPSDIAPSAKRVVIKNIESQIKMPESTEATEYEFKVDIKKQTLSISFVMEEA